MGISLCRNRGVDGLTEESQFLTFMGIRVHFSVSQPEGTLKNRVLLLSSPLINTFHWRKLLPELSQLGCMTVMVDLPGFGRSDCAEEVPMDPDLRASILWGILDNVDSATDAPLSLWHLMGHGSACPTILCMANQYPDSVKSQIHLSPIFSLELRGADKEKLSRWYDATMRSEERFRDLIEHYCGYPLDDYILDRMRRPLLRQGAKENFLRMLKHAAKTPEEGSAGFIPTMAIWGGRDLLMTKSAVSSIHGLLPDAETHVLKSAGHFPMETHSKAIRDYLRGWIRYNE